MNFRHIQSFCKQVTQCCVYRDRVLQQDEIWNRTIVANLDTLPDMLLGPIVLQVRHLREVQFSKALYVSQMQNLVSQLNLVVQQVNPCDFDFPPCENILTSQHTLVLPEQVDIFDEVDSFINPVVEK